MKKAKDKQSDVLITAELRTLQNSGNLHVSHGSACSLVKPPGYLKTVQSEFPECITF